MLVSFIRIPLSCIITIGEKIMLKKQTMMVKIIATILVIGLIASFGLATIISVIK